MHRQLRRTRAGRAVLAAVATVLATLAVQAADTSFGPRGSPQGGRVHYVVP